MTDLDHVTGLASRAAFEDFLARASGSDRALAVVICDVVGLKQVNEHEGFLAGDDVLRGAADRLRQAATKADILARLGGDELVAVFTGGQAVARAAAAAGALADGASRPSLRAGMLAAQPKDSRETLLNRLYATVRRS